jgi:hypothetical protein
MCQAPQQLVMHGEPSRCAVMLAHD